VAWVDDEASLRDFISLVLVYAPDRFPVEDYLSAGEQLNLDSAFEELRRGLQYARILKKEPARRAAATDLLERSYQAYRRSELAVASTLLREFEACLGYVIEKT
jgi:hypothetical protein